MKARPIICIVLLFFYCGLSLSAETVLSSLEEIGRFGADRSIQVLQGELTLRQARLEKVSHLKLKDSSLSGTVQFDFNNSDPQWEAGLALPVLDQVSLSGSIDGNLNSSFAISLSPLAHSSMRELSDQKIRSSAVFLEKARIDGEFMALTLALEWMTAARTYEALKRKTELAEISYKDASERYDRGDVTFDDLQEALLHWSEERKNLSEAEQNLRLRERGLFAFRGDGRKQITIHMLAIDDLKKSLALLKDEQRELSPAAGKNRDLLLGFIERESFATALKHTWSFEPSLTVVAALAFDCSGSMTGSAAVTFSLSPSDFQIRHRAIIKDQYELTAAEVQSLRLEMDLLLRQAEEARVSTMINREIAELELEQTESLMAEAEFLYERGDFSELERDEAVLVVEEAQNGLFGALSNEYLTLIAMKAFY